jgi:hypothetical protein
MDLFSAFSERFSPPEGLFLKDHEVSEKEREREARRSHRAEDFSSGSSICKDPSQGSLKRSRKAFFVDCHR